MNNVFGNGTVVAHYNISWTWSNSTGSTLSDSPSGNFTFSSTSFLYLQGTDNLTGYVNPTVWFYINNSTQSAATFYLLDTQMSVTATSYSYQLFVGRNVYAIRAQGSSNYLRNDVYGRFNADYTWTAYFDPSTGYIIGYDYVEHDTSPFAGFTYTETLFVTSTSYELATAPPNTPGFSQYLGILLLGIVLLLILGITVAVLARRGRRRTLPAHSPIPQAPQIPQGQYYRPPPPPQQGIDLTPTQQPPVQQIVIKEVVKVKCRYCGALSDSTLQVCPFCGAPRT